tara:strand:- start:256 stop:633 length:378 start_codon:yes stop_codon:yes gene_type:complete
MASEYEFDLPWGPSVNGMRAVFRNRLITTKKGRNYHDTVVMHLDLLGLAGEQLEGKLHVSMVLHPPTLRKYDIDNYCKAVFDGLSYGGFWGDDEQVHSLNIKKGEKVKGGLIKLKIRSMKEIINK